MTGRSKSGALDLQVYRGHQRGVEPRGVAYFAASANEAGFYAANHDDSGEVTCARVHISAPATEDDIVRVATEERLALANEDYPVDLLECSEHLVDALRRRGFDGAVGQLMSAGDGMPDVRVYVVFDAERQVRRVRALEGEARRPWDENSPWRSPLIEALSKQLPANLTPAAAAAWLVRHAGQHFPRAELKASGLLTHLVGRGARDPRRPVTADELVRALGGCLPHWYDVVLDAQEAFLDPLRRQLVRHGLSPEFDPLDDAVAFVDADGELLDYSDLPPDAQAIVDEHSRRELGPAKFRAWASRDGGSYWELLVCVDGQAGAAFRSSHWQRDGVVAHVRCSARERLLHIDEVQSDWANALREQRHRLPGQADTEVDAPAALLPLLSQPQGWAALALRRAIHHAAAQGLDAIQLATGDEVVARFAAKMGLKTFYDEILPRILGSVAQEAALEMEPATLGRGPVVRLGEQDRVRVLQAGLSPYGPCSWGPLGPDLELVEPACAPRTRESDWGPQG